MAPNVTTTLSGQKQTVINGRTYNVQEENGKQYVVIDGKRVNLSDPIFNYTSDLTEWPEKLMADCDKWLEKDEEKKAYLRKEASWLEAQMKNAKKMYNGILAKFKVDNYKDIEDPTQRNFAEQYFTDMSDLKFAKISNSNQYYSACMSAFDHALDKGKWSNQLSLAQHAQGLLG